MGSLNSWRTIAGVTFGVAALGVAAWLGSATAPRPGLRAAAPEFSLTDANGAAVRLADYRGRVVMLNFWAIWCAGCKLELPWLSEFQQRYESQGLVSIALSLDDDGWAAIRPYLAEHPVAFPVVAADWDVAKRYAVSGLPLTLLVDRQGRIAASHLGLIDRDAWEAEIQRVLGEAEGPGER